MIPIRFGLASSNMSLAPKQATLVEVTENPPKQATGVEVTEDPSQEPTLVKVNKEPPEEATLTLVEVKEEPPSPPPESTSSSPEVPPPVPVQTLSKEEEFNLAMQYLTELRSSFSSRPEVYSQFLDIMKNFRNKAISTITTIDQVLKLLEGYPQLIAGLNPFLPPEYKLEVIYNFVEGVAPSGMVYEVNTYTSGHLFHQHFAEKLPPPPPAAPQVPQDPGSSTTVAVVPAPVLSLTPLDPTPAMETVVELPRQPAPNVNYDHAILFVNKIKERFKETPEKYRTFIDILNRYKSAPSLSSNRHLEPLTDLQVYIKVSALFESHPDLIEEFRQFLPESFVSPSKDERKSKPQLPATPRLGRPEKVRRPQAITKNVNEMIVDVVKLPRCGEKYRILPPEFKRSVCSGRDSLANQVLNDTLVACPDSTKMIPIRRHVGGRRGDLHKTGDRFEEERVELDLVISINRDTVKVFERVMQEMALMGEAKLEQFQLDDCLGGRSPTIHQAAVRRLYGDKADVIIQGLMQRPQAAVPIVLRRMVAKDREWMKAKEKFNKFWSAGGKKRSGFDV